MLKPFDQVADHKSSHDIFNLQAVTDKLFAFIRKSYQMLNKKQIKLSGKNHVKLANNEYILSNLFHP